MKRLERMVYVLLGIAFIAFMMQYHLDLFLLILKAIGLIIIILVLIIMF